jgi:hypothetical protein
VTVSRRYLREGTQSSYSADIWLNGVQRIFSEENVHYRVDRLGGVHFKFDEEFERVTAAAISILQPRRYANFLDGFNQALRALAEGPPDGKGAIRATFTAIEGLFALMIPEVNRLAAGQTSRYGQPSNRYTPATGALRKPPLRRLDRCCPSIPARTRKAGHGGAAAFNTGGLFGQHRRISFAMAG